MKLRKICFTDPKIIHRIQGQDRSRNGTGFIGSERAQLAVDYIAGVSIFLLTAAFVFQFMYGLFVPFQSGSDEVKLAANRAGTILVERTLVVDKSETINVIDQGKLNYFSKTKLNYSNLTAYYSTLLELGLISDETIMDMNISVANLTFPDNPLIQCGPQLVENIDIGQIKRMVLIVNSSTGYNETAIISVRVW